MSNANIVLINPPQLKGVKGLQVQSPSPPLGLAYLGAYLKQHGVDYFAIDGCARGFDRLTHFRGQEDVLVQGISLEEVSASIPTSAKLVGLTCMFSHNWAMVKDVCSQLKKDHPDLLVVLGGEHATSMTQMVLDSGVVDIVVRGEGEETFLDLSNKVIAGENWRELPGVSYRTETGCIEIVPARKRMLQIDDIPIPDWDSWHITGYIERNQVCGINLGRSIPILGTRGCPFQCTFCASPNMWTTKYIMRDPKSIVDEMELMNQKYGVQNFNFMDLTFIVHRKKVLSFANELIDRNLNVTYQLPAGTRCEAFDLELVQALEKSGLRNLALAPESGSEEMRLNIKKKVKLDKLLEAVRLILKTRITLCIFFVMGFPGETRKSIRETIRLIRRLALLGVHDVAVSSFFPYPGSELYRDIKEQGKLEGVQSKEGEMIDFFSADTPSFCDISSLELHLWQYWAYLNFYLISGILRPWRFANNVLTFFRTGHETTRYMKVFSELLVNRKKWKKGTQST